MAEQPRGSRMAVRGLLIGLAVGVLLGFVVTLIYLAVRS